MILERGEGARGAWAHTECNWFTGESPAASAMAKKGGMGFWWGRGSKRGSEKINYKLFINDDGAEIHTEWEIKSNTLQTYGKNNIIDKFKDFIEIALSNPYTYKIKTLDVHVNKEIFQPKQYRYLGGITRFDKRKTKIMYNILKHGMRHLITKDLF